MTISYLTEIRFKYASLAIFACCLAVVSIRSLAQPPVSASVQATDEHQLPAPFQASLPSIYIVGDSTASYHPDRDHEGYAAPQGWGVFFPAFFDPNKVNVVNVARGGRSSRTYMTEGLWDKVVERLKPNDVVLIQLGQNDVFPTNDKVARGTIPGIGQETQEIDNIATGKHETVHTYGWYLRRYVRDTRAKGAVPIVLSLTTRDVWKDGHVEVGVGNYRESAYKIALQEQHTDFVDASGIIAEQYEKLGQEKTAGLFHAKEPVHINTPGAFLDARCIVAGLKELPDAPVSRYLSYLGEQVETALPVPVPPEWEQEGTEAAK